MQDSTDMTAPDWLLKQDFQNKFSWHCEKFREKEKQQKYEI